MIKNIRSFTDISVQTPTDDPQSALDRKKYNLVGKPVVYGDSYNVCDCFTETIDVGALDGCDLSDVRFLINHDTNIVPLARHRDGQESTMDLTVTDAGLEIACNLDVEHDERAKQLLNSIERGDLSGMSFMFDIGDDYWVGIDTPHPVRHITKITKIYEVSAVTFPAYEQTSIETRSLNDGKSDYEAIRLKAEIENKLGGNN